MSGASEDPHCPECGEPIGQTATYCMHCSADLTAERDAADADADGVWDGAEPQATGAAAGESGADPRDGPVEGRRTLEDAISSSGSGSASESWSWTEGQLLDPDGFVDNTLTVVVGILGGIVVGVVATVVLGVVTGSAWAVLFGVATWLGATAYLVRQRTVQGAVSKSAYAIAVVLLLVPVIALSPVVSVAGGLEERGSLFLVLLVFVAVPALVAAAVGWVASRFVPAEPEGAGAET